MGKRTKKSILGRQIIEIRLKIYDGPTSGIFVEVGRGGWYVRIKDNPTLWIPL